MRERDTDGVGGNAQRVNAANGALMNEKIDFMLIDLPRGRVASKQVCTHSRR